MRLHLFPIALFLSGFALSSSAAKQAPELSPQQILRIAHATGKTMRVAGFDSARHIKFGQGDQYIPESDTVIISPNNADDLPSDLLARYTAIPQALRIAATAVHENCHAYLIKHRHHLPHEVQQAAETCHVMPQARNGAFEETFCDMAEKVITDRKAGDWIMITRENEDPANPDEPDLQGHSLPLLKAALAADNPRLRTPVKRIAAAMTQACQQSWVQSRRGTEEKRWSQQLRISLSKTLAAPLDLTPEVLVVPYANWGVKEKRKFNRLREDMGDGPLISFKATFNACMAYLDGPNAPDRTVTRSALENCKAGTRDFDVAFCTAISYQVISQEVDSPVQGLQRLLPLLTPNAGLGKRWLALEQNHHVSVYASHPTHPIEDIALDLRAACGEHLAERDFEKNER